MEQKRFNELAQQIIEASTEKILDEFQIIKEDFDYVDEVVQLLKIDTFRIKWLQDWYKNLENAKERIEMNQPDKETFKTINNAIQWIEFDFSNEKLYEDFNSYIKQYLK